MSTFVFTGKIAVDNCESKEEALKKIDRMNEDDSIYDSYQISVLTEDSDPTIEPDDDE